jgi:transcriptional regulator with XRE-family HTH domain
MFAHPAVKVRNAMSAGADYEKELAALLEALGGNIRELREAKLPELSQEEVAQKAKLHRTEWGMIEQGKRNPRFSTLLVMAETLGITLDELAEGLDPPKHRKPAPGTKKHTRPAP